MGALPVFEDEDSLPLTEIQLAVGHRHVFTGARDSRSQMGWHVIGALGCVSVGGVVFRSELLEPLFQVSPGGWVCIFGDDQAGTGVAQEDGTDPRFYIGALYRFAQGQRDLV